MLKMIDLFAGIGGIRIAFENNGIKCVMSSEIDKYAAETYAINFGETPKGDITKIPLDEIPEFDIIAGGFPCQPFSIGGLRKGFEDTRGTLFFEIEKIIKERRPKAFFLENVAGLVSHDNGKTLEVIESRLHELGYNSKWKLMNAYNYGVPQNRNRWYCVGFREDLKIGFQEQKNAIYSKFYQFPKERKLTFTINDIVKDIEDERYNITEIAQFNINNFLAEYLVSKRYNASQGNIILANEIRASRCNFRSDGISPCLTAKMGTGGNNVPVYIKQMRKLTERECLKIMGFPDTYQIKENSSHSYKQIGNSVVVSVIEEIAKEIVRVLL
ncbi:DNA (cytosine-5)-methyltransferase 1 [Natranaerovirga pectinivora]|uniref:Cytosine-specific methyltransferase n=1 Tax=Natranaerovirga pectinivora TaxID=682400 RepID=A0A4R3MMI0_9FIRM|nr:DNA cytosine methyltransferase [Natranaerovirga pectinivora]TCT15503.1 DNA (cytosine-5)-methyltransferase 1 [Natranaerovirga pectinivora]